MSKEKEIAILFRSFCPIFLMFAYLILHSENLDVPMVSISGLNVITTLQSSDDYLDLSTVKAEKITYTENSVGKIISPKNKNNIKKFVC